MAIFLIGIISTKFNFTVADPTTSTTSPRLSICKKCAPALSTDSSNLPEARYGHNTILVNEQSLFYCTSSVSFNSKSACSFLLAPFDTWIWITILGAIILTGVIYWRPWFSLNIVWGLLHNPGTGTTSNLWLLFP